MDKLITVLITIVFIVSCGDDLISSKIPSKVPQVAGTYAGPLEIIFSATPGIKLTGSMKVIVIQAGSQLTITGSVTLIGTTIQLTAISGTINSSGYFTIEKSGGVGQVRDKECGVLRTLSFSITFLNNSIKYVEDISTDYCGIFQFSGTLSKY